METDGARYKGHYMFLQKSENGWTLELRDDINGPSVDSRTFSAANLDEAQAIAKGYVDSLKANADRHSQASEKTVTDKQ